MRRLIISLVTLSLFCSLFVPVLSFGAENQAPSSSETPRSKRVIVVLAPFVTWHDISPEKTPAIWSAAKTGAIGDLNARSRAKEPDGLPSLIEGALTISSGAWPMIDASAYSAYDIHESFEYDTAGDAYGRIMGNSIHGEKIVYLGLPRLIAHNERNSFKVIPGTLGSAVEAAGGATAAIGNSDLGYSSDAQRALRPAAIAAMNEKGTVRFGSVSEAVLKRNPEAPYGVQTDRTAIARILASVKSDLDPTKPGLIVLDPGDGYRAKTVASTVSPDVAAKQWDDSLQALDAIYAMATTQFPDDVVILASQASKDERIQREGFGPVVMSNLKTGLLTSDSTQRAGLVTNLDITATIIDVLGIEEPVQVLGSAMSSTMEYSTGLPGSKDGGVEQRVDLLKKMNATALAIENNRAAVLNTFIVLTVLILVFGAFVILRAGDHWRVSSVRYAKRALYLLILGVLSVPASSWLMFLIYRWPSTPIQVTTQLLAVAFVLWAMAVLLSVKYGQRVPVVFLAITTSLVIIIDQLLGAPASFTSFFGYSPIAAARFYGIGNEGAAVLFGAVVIGIAMSIDQWPTARWVKPLKTWGIILIGAVVVVVSAAPFLGANVGVAAWGTVGFALMWLLMNDKRISLLSVAAVFALVVAVVGVFILIDTYGSGAETHLARSIGSAEKGGLVQLWDIVVRKAETNLRVLTHTNFAYILVAVIGFLALMRWRPSGDFAKTLQYNPCFADVMTATLVAGLAAYFTEDSGIVLPALMVLYLGAGIVWLMLGPITGRPDDAFMTYPIDGSVDAGLEESDGERSFAEDSAR